MGSFQIHGYDVNNNLKFTFVIDNLSKKNIVINCVYNFSFEEFVILKIKNVNFSLVSINSIVKEFNNILENSTLYDFKDFPLTRENIESFMIVHYPQELQLMKHYELIADLRNQLSPIVNYFEVIKHNPNWYNDATIYDIMLREQDICCNQIIKIKELLNR